MTEDISSTGALFVAQHDAAIGSMLEWNLHLPAAVMGTESSVQVECIGRVVWTSADPRGYRVGAVIDHYELKDQQP